MQKFLQFIVLPIILSAVFGLSIFFVSQHEAFAQLSKEQEKILLEAQLKLLETEIANIETDITKTQAEKDTLKNQISVLRSKIKKLDLQIEQSTVLIGDLRSQITDTSSSIEKTSAEIEAVKAQIGQVLRRVYAEDQKSKVEIVLAGETISDFFSNMASLGALNGRLKVLLANTKELNSSLNEQKNALESDKEEEENFVKIQILQKQENQNLQSQTTTLLDKTEGKEAEYQKQLADKKAKAAEIRSRIFELVGVSQAPTFGEALEIAKMASARTGVRPALLLAVLTQESNLGKNVGQCYLVNTTSGASAGINSGRQFSNGMHKTRDLPPFLRITQDLGRDPLKTPVSCPIPSVGGYGGAMGPAQFIPSTWQGYKPRLDSMLGRPADPWNISDAFLASALYLADGGAAKQTYDAEWCAVQAYFSGRCTTSYRFYGDSVMNLAAKYQKDIDILEGT